MCLDHKRAEINLLSVGAVIILFALFAPLAAAVGWYEERLRKQRDRGEPL